MSACSGRSFIHACEPVVIVLAPTLSSSIARAQTLPDLSSYPQLHSWVGLIGFVTVLAAAISFIWGLRQKPKADPDDKNTQVGREFYIDSTLLSVFEALKRVEAALADAKAKVDAAALGGERSDAQLRELVLTAHTATRHALIDAFQEMVSAQERQHGQNHAVVNGINARLASIEASLQALSRRR
jgi:hypothetical protein